MIPRIRLYSGFVLFAYVTVHLTNHIAGIVSLDAMNAVNRYLGAPWRTLPGTVLLAGALAAHVSLAFYGLYERRRLTMKPWQVAQLFLGLAIPLLLAGHVAGTRIVDEAFGFRGNYTVTLTILWVLSPEIGIQQAVALLGAWIHGCIGMHMWLRLTFGYAAWRGWALAAAVLLPALALAGYVSAGMEVRALAELEGWIGIVMESYGRGPAAVALVDEVQASVRWSVVAAIAIALLLREARRLGARRRRGVVLSYAPGDRRIAISPGGTMLESIRAAGIQHTSVCGGRGRCSTCRVRVDRGREHLPPPSGDERKVLQRLGFDDGAVRLACQVRPADDVTVTALLPHDGPTRLAAAQPSHHKGEEIEVAILFVDLRGSTRLSEERLPFDVVFILNQFFAELSAALDETNGHYAQFNGDGLMALYGLDSGVEQGCREVLNGAREMLRRVEALSGRLAGELDEPLRIGIGIHVGEAIVGSMGPPATPIVSALGDHVNIAALLEAMTKELGVRLCVSARTLERAGLDVAGMTIHEMPVKGRERPVRVIGLDDPPSTEA